MVEAPKSVGCAKLIDRDSLFIAAGLCAAALALPMLSVWIHNRSDRFLAGWAAGMLLLATGVILYSTLPPDNMAIAATAFTMEAVGFVIVFIAARQFAGRATSFLQIVLLLLTAVPVGLPIALGYDGFGIMVYNFLAGWFLVASAAQYWKTRSEAPSSMALLCLLYILAAISFFACGAVLLHEAEWSMGRRPDNWAEQLNAIMCIIGITGVGALSLGLNHARAARRHRQEARTDILTGLLNRRALFDSMSGQDLQPGHAVVAFDLDDFKAINDRHGHAIGDEVLRRFADAMRVALREDDIAARIGGEEFVLVLRNASSLLATSTAERIRAIFAQSRVETANGLISGTASAGVALVQIQSESFESVLHRADTSLYRAKDSGRDKVVAELQAVA